MLCATFPLMYKGESTTLPLDVQGGIDGGLVDAKSENAVDERQRAHHSPSFKSFPSQFKSPEHLEIRFPQPHRTRLWEC